MLMLLIPCIKSLELDLKGIFFAFQHKFQYTVLKISVYIMNIWVVNNMHYMKPTAMGMFEVTECWEE